MTLSTTDKVLVGAAVLYTAVVLGTRTTTVAAIGTHEAMHAYWEGNGSVQFRGSLSDPILTGEAQMDGTRSVPHIIPKAAGWLVAGALLLPWFLAAAKVAKPT